MKTLIYDLLVAATPILPSSELVVDEVVRCPVCSSQAPSAFSNVRSKVTVCCERCGTMYHSRCVSRLASFNAVTAAFTCAACAKAASMSTTQPQEAEGGRRKRHRAETSDQHYDPSIFLDDIQEVCSAAHDGDRHDQSVVNAAPPPYRHIKTCKWLTEKPQPRRETYKSGKCDCSSGCSHSCPNRLNDEECTAATCQYGEDPGMKCTNRQIQRRQGAHVQVRYAEGKGFGLFASEDIGEGNFIIEYVGDVIDDAECARRLSKSKAEGRQSFYIMEIEEDVNIDAGQSGNEARFSNHSCQPNCKPLTVRVNGVPRIGFFADSRIRKGDEITFDYRWIDFAERPWACRCGSKNCRGVLGAKKKDVKGQALGSALVSGADYVVPRASESYSMLGKTSERGGLLSVAESLPNMTSRDFDIMRNGRVNIVGLSAEGLASRGFRKSRTVPFRRGLALCGTPSQAQADEVKQFSRMIEVVTYERNPAQQNTEDSFNDISCFDCGNPGDLFCCEFCKKSYHKDCSKNAETADDKWRCSACLKKLRDTAAGKRRGPQVNHVLSYMK